MDGFLAFAQYTPAQCEAAIGRLLAYIDEHGTAALERLAQNRKAGKGKPVTAHGAATGKPS